MSKIKDNSGFSLVELGIVVSIIGLLVAAITAGASMKTKLEVIEVVNKIGDINNAYQEFQKSYGHIPGDVYNAAELLGTGITGGNGDNDLADGSEAFLFWQHLSLSGLIDGTYNGTSDKMRMPIKYGEFTAVKATAAANLYIIASKAGSVGLFTTKQGFDIDSKYDDSNPTTGVIRAADGAGETAGDCVSGGAHNLTNNTESPCILHFYLEQ